MYKTLDGTRDITYSQGNNRVYAPSASVAIQCSGSMSFEQFESIGLDPGTQLFDSPNITDIIQWGRDVLGF